MLDFVTLLLAPSVAVMLVLPFGLYADAPAEGRQMRAVYLFHQTDEPIAMVAPDHAPPMAPEELGPIIWTVRDFAATWSDSLVSSRVRTKAGWAAGKRHAGSRHKPPTRCPPLLAAA